MPYATPSSSPVVAPSLLFSPVSAHAPFSSQSCSRALSSQAHLQHPSLFSNSTPVNPQINYSVDSNSSSIALQGVPRSRGTSKVKLDLSNQPPSPTDDTASFTKSASLAPTPATFLTQSSPSPSPSQSLLGARSTIQRARSHRAAVSLDVPELSIVGPQATNSGPCGSMATIGRRRGEDLKLEVSSNNQKAISRDDTSTTPSPTATKRLHQAVMAGQGGVLRLNLDAIKRSRSDIISTTTPVSASSTAHASRAKFNTIGSSTSSINLIRKKSGELVKPALRQSSFRAEEEAGVATPLLSTPTPPAASHRSGPSNLLQRRNSAPSTPGTKFVHFDSQLEHVKLFLAEQKPAAVSRDGSPTAYSTTEDEWPWYGPSSKNDKAGSTLKAKVLKGLPVPSADKSELITDPAADVKLESLTLTDDGCSLRGTVVVKNLCFDKWIAARFTMDWWQTTSEVTGKYLESIVSGPSGKLTASCLSPFAYSDNRPAPAPTHDRFVFTIKLNDVLARIEEKAMFIALRFNAAGKEMWDNNDGQNYHVVFEKVKVTSSVNAKIAPVVTVSPGVAASSSGWQVKNATSSRDQMADLRKELEKVVKDDGPSQPAKLVKAKTFSVANHSNESSPSLSPAGLATPQDLPVLAKSSEKLASRYDFTASLKNTWNPPPLPPLPPNVPLYQRASSVSKPSNASIARTMALPPSSTDVSPGTIPFPSSEQFPSADSIAPKNITHRGPASNKALGSPRDCSNVFEDGQMAVFDAAAAMEIDGSVRFGMSAGLSKDQGQRNHRRRGASSYFDGWAESVAMGLKKTPPGTPIMANHSDTEVSSDLVGSQVAAPDDKDSAASHTEGSDTETEQLATDKIGLGLALAEANVVAIPDSLQHQSPTLRSGSATPQNPLSPSLSPVRFKSFPPMDSPPSRRAFYGLPAIGPLSPPPPSSLSAPDGNKEADGHHWGLRSDVLPFTLGGMHNDSGSQSPTDDSVASTPSITSSSSPSQSPSSPSHSLPLSPPADLDVAGMFSQHGSARNRPSIDSMDYNFFLNRFCFFTGGGGLPSSDSALGGIPPRRIHSESEVDTYFHHQSHVVGSNGMYGSSPSIGFPPYSGARFAGNGVLSSGHTTPTRSPHPDADCGEKGIVTPRPSSPVEELSATPVRYTPL